MEKFNTKIHNTPLFPIASIGYTSCNFLGKEQSDSDTCLVASPLMCKFGASKKKNQKYLYQNFHTKDSKLKGVTYFLANNPATQATLLDFISTTRVIVFLEAIGTNKNTSITTLKRLANHHSPRVRIAVAENPHTPFEILSQLCKDENVDVRFAMAENPNVPKSLLSDLINDDNPYISSRAYKTLARLKDDESQSKQSKGSERTSFAKASINLIYKALN